MLSRLLSVLASGSLLCAAQNLVTDPGVAGPPLELVHVYYDEWPTGIAVSSTGRMFSNYPPGFDKNNTNDGTNGKYTVAELISNSTERAYPSVEINNPPGGAINYSTYPATGANYPNYLIGVQSVVIDPLDRLWILDTGRALTPNGTLVPSSYGGPKLIGVSLSNNTIFSTILFPPTVAYPDSYLNDVRFDLRPNLTTTGKGIAYITDSSNEGRNGIIIVDLGTGESWRHLDSNPAVRAQGQFVAFVWGTPLYSIPGPSLPATYTPVGSDGITLSADGADLYWSAVGSRYLHSVPTARLRDRSTFSEILAQSSVVNRGQKGVSDGFESDSEGIVYFGNVEQGSVDWYSPVNGTTGVLVRDPRLNWIDTFSVSTDGYLYFTTNQLFLTPSFYPGTDRRVRPFALFRVKLPNGGSKILLR
ncbi:hypothetical protein K490DRAFT_70000 [Saccharata proteae CBS 121410]|uniref:Major royal jelly protein n=1 Tax=Saccharata proteae CBS 121410 TaxID=1314787 RepID=A0A9P4HKI0_9PEZI|nr:hypothetical protein K490DRAFT_70000 [Saccharata proteae CBS 121410]